jgi:hypothetical protein
VSELVTVRLIWLAGAIHVGIILANIPLPRRLRVRENLASAPLFLRQIFYVHWLYIVLLLALFVGLCFGFAPELAGGSRLGRFLSSFLAGFWLLRVFLQTLYYDRQIRKDNRLLEAIYVAALVVLVGIFGWVALRPSV